MREERREGRKVGPAGGRADARGRRLLFWYPFKLDQGIGCSRNVMEGKEQREKRAQGEGRGISNLCILRGFCAGLNYAPRGGGRSGALQNEHVTRPPGPVTPLCAAKMAAAGRAIPADATVQTRAGTSKVLHVPRRPPTYSASLVPHGRLTPSPLRTQGSEKKIIVPFVKSFDIMW